MTDPTTTAGASTVPVSNVWIWLVVFAPSVSIVLLPFVQFPAPPPLDATDDPMAMFRWQLELFLDPVLIVVTILGWAGTVVAIVAAYRDWKLLTASGLQRPFHWAFVFLNLVVGPVYAIGRAVVVRQRTGRGIAVLWAAIATLVVTWGIAIAWTTVITIDIVTQIMRMPGLGG